MSPERQEGSGFRITPIEETDASIRFQVASPKDEILIVSFTPPNKVSFEFGGQEVIQAPEREEITIEGNPVRPAKYDKNKHTYNLRLAYHPNPQDRTVAEFYNVVAEGERADDFFKLFITDTRLQLHITGEDISNTTKLDKGTKGLIRADNIEKLQPGQRASSEIMRWKVWGMGESKE